MTLEGGTDLFLYYIALPFIAALLLSLFPARFQRRSIPDGWWQLSLSFCLFCF